MFCRYFGLIVCCCLERTDWIMSEGTWISDDGILPLIPFNLMAIMVQLPSSHWFSTVGIESSIVCKRKLEL